MLGGWLIGQVVFGWIKNNWFEGWMVHLSL